MVRKVVISNRLFYTLIAIGILAVVAVVVYAAVPNPGHSASEIDWSGALVNNPVTAFTSNYTSISIGGKSYLIPLYVQTTYLIGRVHTAIQCTNMGGVVVTDPSVLGSENGFCKISANFESCPSGWNLYSGWTETSPATCDGTRQQLLSFFPFVSAVPCGGSSCTTGSHSFAELDPETCQYEQRQSDFSCPTSPQICTAFITKIGCY